MIARDPKQSRAGGSQSEAGRSEGANARRHRTFEPFKFLSFDELISLKPSPYIVQGVIRAGELVVIYAASSAGKTFVTLGMALSMICGLEWCGRRTKGARALFLAGEGVGTFMLRCQAWLRRHPEGAVRVGLRFQVLPHSFAFMDDAQFERFITGLKAMPEPPDLVIIDTLARYMAGGDESSAPDMGTFVMRCDRIREETGAAVVVIHHTGKGNNKTEERGSSVLGAAADVRLFLKRSKDILTLVGMKAKDGKELEPTMMRLEVVPLGVDEDGDPLTSCIVVPVTNAEKPSSSPPREDRGARIREVLLHADGGIATGPELEAATGFPHATLHRYLTQELEAGRVVCAGEGHARRYSRPGRSSPRQAGGEVHSDPVDSKRGPASTSSRSKSESTTPLKGVDDGLDEGPRSGSVAKDQTQHRHVSKSARGKDGDRRA